MRTLHDDLPLAEQEAIRLEDLADQSFVTCFR